MGKTIPVILAGGIGERFWPMSRSSSPKQLHAIGSDKSMLEETLARVRECCEDGVKPILVTGAGIAGQVVKALGNTADSVEIIAEPQGKNTAPAIAITAAIINNRYGGGAVMAVVSADHAIKPVQEFTAAVYRAADVARTRGGLVVFGIKPSRPETGYGYIELGEQLQINVNENINDVNCNVNGNINDANCNVNGNINNDKCNVNGNINSNTNACTAFKVKRFVEKPDAENAEKFMKSGKFLWNSGMFVWTAAAILDEFSKHMPELYNQAMDAANKNFSTGAINEFYSVCRKESIDFGIMEKAENVSAVCGNFFWDDLGSWESLSRVYESNKQGTTVTGSLVYERDCAYSLIVNKSPLTVAAVGLANIAVVAVDDALMVIDRSRLPDLKKYLAEIKGSGKFPSELF